MNKTVDKETNYYELLEVPTNASYDEIRNNYIRAKNAYSNDSIALYSLMSESECHSILEKIEEAYSILSIPSRRKEYDKAKGLNKDLDIHMENDRSDKDYYQESATSKEDTAGHEQTATSPSNDNDFTIQQKDVHVSKFTAKKRFSLDYKKNQNFEQEIENTTDFTGEFLKKIREYKQVTIERMADMTKVSKTYLRYIEEDNYQKLPAIVFCTRLCLSICKVFKTNP